MHFPRSNWPKRGKYALKPLHGVLAQPKARSNPPWDHFSLEIHKVASFMNPTHAYNKERSEMKSKLKI